MSEPSSDRPNSPHEDEQPTGDIRYPTNHVLGVLDSEAQLTTAADALRRGGFLEPVSYRRGSPERVPRVRHAWAA